MLLGLCLLIGLQPITAFANETGRALPTKAHVKAVFSNAAVTAGADSQICAATVKDKSGDFVLHYVYSKDGIWNVQLFDRVRDGLAEPYKSLIPVLEKDDDNKKGFLFLSDGQYEGMDLDWADPAAVAEALISGSGTVTTEENTSSVFSGTSIDIIDEHCSDYDGFVVETINEIGESIARPTGANIIEAIGSVSKGGAYYIVEDGITKECYDVVISVHVAKISAYTATKTAAVPIPGKPVGPVIIAGANGTWQKGSKDGLSFTSSADYSDFIKVQVDGKDLDDANYTVMEGSTVVILRAEYLQTLSAGKHSLSIVSKNDTATTEFTITAAQALAGVEQTEGDQSGGDATPQEPDKNEGDAANPPTGDDSNVALWIAVMLAAGIALTGTVLYSRKRKYSK